MTAWAEGRAPWRHDPSADPGAKTEGGRHDAAQSFPFGIGTKAANRPHLFPCALYLISRPRFLHFTLNHYTSTRTAGWLRCGAVRRNWASASSPSRLSNLAARPGTVGMTQTTSPGEGDVLRLDGTCSSKVNSSGPR